MFDNDKQEIVNSPHAKQVKAKNYTEIKMPEPSQYTIRRIKKFAQKFEKDQEENTDFRGTIERLEHYKNSIDTTIIGLEKKLENGQRQEFYDFALRAKESFAKKIAEHTFSENAQQIYALLLGEVYVGFNNHVYPHILEGKDIASINAIVELSIVNHIENLLGEDADVLEIYKEEINGMLYFLTGNCHIKWN